MFDVIVVNCNENCKVHDLSTPSVGLFRMQQSNMSSAFTRPAS